MESLIEEVLTFSTMAREEVKLEAVSVEKLIDSLIAERPELRSPRVDIVVRRPLALVKGNVACLTQCITNLLGNAIKYVPCGSAPRVSIWSELLGDQVRLWFEDNGIGIDQASQGRLFQAFYRVEPRAEYPGTGIGLAIVRKAVERMKGGVGVISAPGQGSRFWLLLPNGQQEEAISDRGREQLGRPGVFGAAGQA